MSLEARLETLENAVIALTEVLKASTSGAAVTAGTKANTTKPETKEEGEKAKPARASRTAKADKVPTVKDLQTAAQKFLDEAEADEDLYADRRGEIKRIADQYEIKRLTECEEKDRADIIKALADFAEENPVGGDNGDSGI